MSIQGLGTGERFVHIVNEAVRNCGIQLYYGSDLEEFASVVENERPGHTIANAFDPTSDSFGDAPVTWILGRDRNGTLVHAQSLRLIDLEKKSLGDFLSAKFRLFAPAGLNVDEVRSTYRPGPGSVMMRGKVAYHGEFWINAGLTRLGGATLSSVLCRLGFWQAFQQWDPEGIFCFMANQVAFKGFPARAGWTHMEPGAIRLFTEDKDTPVEGVLSYILNHDIDYILNSLEQMQAKPPMSPRHEIQPTLQMPSKQNQEPSVHAVREQAAA